MTARTANLINALALILISLWAYIANGLSSETTLIPVAFGALLLLCHPFMTPERRIVPVIAALLTGVIFAALFTPLTSSIDKGAALAVARVAAMVATSAFALAIFAKTFLGWRRRA